MKVVIEKYTCDLCGKETRAEDIIPQVYYPVIVRSHYLNGHNYTDVQNRHYDICNCCARKTMKIVSDEYQKADDVSMKTETKIVGYDIIEKLKGILETNLSSIESKLERNRDVLHNKALKEAYKSIQEFIDEEEKLSEE